MKVSPFFIWKYGYGLECKRNLLTTNCIWNIILSDNEYQ